MGHNALDGLAVAALETAGRSLWGFRPRLMPVIVERLGAVPAIAWFASNMPRYESTLRAYGGVRTHLLATTISLINGCAYCSFGHAYALQLIYLRDHGRLLPLDEQAITDLRLRGPAQIRDRLAGALAEAGLDEEIPWVDRLIALSDGSCRPQDSDDVRLVHLISMFRVLNECGIAGAVLPDEAHDPSNKDAALRRRYRALRSETSTG